MGWPNWHRVEVKFCWRSVPENCQDSILYSQVANICALALGDILPGILSDLLCLENSPSFTTLTALSLRPSFHKISADSPLCLSLPGFLLQFS